MLTTSRSTAFFSTSSSLHSVCFLLFSLWSLVGIANAATADDWRSRSVYQIITDRFARTDGSTDSPCNITAELYCGGTFQGIINQLDYIQDMGFGAIWISPVVQNINETTAYGEGYHGFWTQDITKINEHFGTPDDLKSLSKSLHDRGMYLMIDIVVNDMAYPGKGASTDYSTFVPFDKEEYFHPFCFITDYNNQTNAQDCWLGDDTVALADLDTESEFVQQTWQTWVTEMVANYSLDGLRIDAAKHVDKPFWAPFQAAADTFTLGEVFDVSAENACYWADDALTSVLNYPAWYYITSVLANSSISMNGLEAQFNTIQANCHDTTTLGTFSENHDVARFGWYTSDASQRATALVFNLFTDGIPVVYYGAEQGFSGANDPFNRAALWLSPGGYDTTSSLYTLVKTLNTARNAVGDYLSSVNYQNWSAYWAYKASVIYTAEDIIVWRKGNVQSCVTALTNRGEDGGDVGPYWVGDTGFQGNALVVEVLSCASTVTGSGGDLNITLVGGAPQVWVPGSLLVNTTLCPEPMKNVNKSSSSISTSSASSNYRSCFGSWGSVGAFLVLLFIGFVGL